MRAHLPVLATALLALAACGGKSAASKSPSRAGDGFDPTAVKQTIGAMAVPEACNNGDGAATLAAHLDAQRESLGGAASTEESLECQPPMDGHRECTWSVFNKPSTAPSEDDPCGGECCSGYQVIFHVDDAGAIDASSIICNAPG